MVEEDRLAFPEPDPALQEEEPWFDLPQREVFFEIEDGIENEVEGEMVGRHHRPAPVLGPPLAHVVIPEAPINPRPAVLPQLQLLPFPRDLPIDQRGTARADFVG